MKLNFNLPDIPPEYNFKQISLLEALMEASTHIGELKGYCSSLPNPMLFMSLAAVNESVESSKIEAIHTTIKDVLEGEALPEKERSLPEKEVLRYREAMNWGHKNLNKFGLTSRLILGIHKILLPEGGGNYRKQQNTIINELTRKSIYQPPPFKEIDRLMSNWENFVNNHQDNIHPIIKCAIAHYQFESIHPFSDGNGRTGRILMVLQMVETKLLDYPVLYISGYLNKNRPAYYQIFEKVTQENDWETLCLFLINAFKETSLKTKSRLFFMMSEYQKLEKLIRIKFKNMKATETAQHLFSTPVTTPTIFGQTLGIHYTTASKYLDKLKQAEVLVDRKIGKNHFYYNKTLLKMISK
jgi:Fic family protein